MRYREKIKINRKSFVLHPHRDIRTLGGRGFFNPLPPVLHPHRDIRTRVNVAIAGRSKYVLHPHRDIRTNQLDSDSKDNPTRVLHPHRDIRTSMYRKLFRIVRKSFSILIGI